MLDLVERALSADRESKRIEFKQGFDPNSPGEWCELIKDIVAISNSGGGIIVFGLDSRGTPTGTSVEGKSQIDPADIVNKLSRYTGAVDLELDIRELEKNGRKLQAFVIQPASMPLVFQKPGTYVGSGKQRTAFSVGTIYFRHGAKSEPGASDDIRLVIQRHVESIRKSWTKDIRKVTQAPLGSQVITVQPVAGVSVSSLVTNTVRAVNDPKATPVLLTRDRTKAKGSFIHEEVSEGLFDEIDNVVDANRILARGRPKFLLGPSVYYRIYAERHHVVQSDDNLGALFHSAAIDLYAPSVFWTLTLSEQRIACTFAELYLYPKSPSIHFAMRFAVLLGADFCKWLDERWTRKWKRHPQPPSFYWTFRDMNSKITSSDPRLIAARLSASARIEVPGESTARVAELLGKRTLTSSLLSKACMAVFQGDLDLRSVARELDYVAYGLEVQKRALKIAKAITKAIGDQEAGDPAETTEES